MRGEPPIPRPKPPCRCHYPVAAGVLPDGSIEYICLYCSARLVPVRAKREPITVKGAKEERDE